LNPQAEEFVALNRERSIVTNFYKSDDEGCSDTVLIRPHEKKAALPTLPSSIWHRPQTNGNSKSITISNARRVAFVGGH
jgi:hypothetical protein